METKRKGNVTAETASEIAARATWYVNQVDAGAHADKRIANRFGISVSMAKLLRRGEGWTLARIEQARRSFGPSFDHMVFGPMTGGAGGRDELAEHIAALRALAESMSASWLRGPVHMGRPEKPAYVVARAGVRGDAGMAGHGPVPADRPAGDDRGGHAQEIHRSNPEMKAAAE